MTLLGTRDGQYAAACALDFLNPPWNWVDAKTRGSHPPGVYDDVRFWGIGPSSFDSLRPRHMLRDLPNHALCFEAQFFFIMQD